MAVIRLDGIPHTYQMDQSILRVVECVCVCVLSEFFYLIELSHTNTEDPDQTHLYIKLCQIWVCTVCLCPAKRTLGL